MSPTAISERSTQIDLRAVFEPCGWPSTRLSCRTGASARAEGSINKEASLVQDRFAPGDSASCCFLRLSTPESWTARFLLQGSYGLESCAAGGWLLTAIQSAQSAQSAYWIPWPPVLRAYDAHGRILSEEPAPLAAFRPTSAHTTLEVHTQPDSVLECTIWRLDNGEEGLSDALRNPRVLEGQTSFMLSSHASASRLADVYAGLVHGQVYENKFDFQRKRRICSELEAYAIYLALHGLEAATGKRLYALVKQQIILSVISRQTEDGTWHHGEWTDLMESHYRFHTAAMLLLAAALEEQPDETVRAALERAAAHIVSRADRTEIGLWFPHDSLEQSAEMMDEAHPRWIASREFGKSPATKMILNTHLDAIVALRRYQVVTGDDRYQGQITSALSAARTLLTLRPAERLYRALYRAVDLTLLPEAEAKELPLPLRAVKRATRNYVLPNLYRVKRRFPRMVMPGGLIERHLSRLHFGVNYHSVNLADLARVWRLFPTEPFGEVIDGAIRAVTETSLLPYWVENKQRQALGYWVEALYHLCTIRDVRAWRSHLAQAILAALDAGLGLPPSLLGAHPEVVRAVERFPCPSPADSRLRVANLSRPGSREVLVVNSSTVPIPLAFEDCREIEFGWTAADEAPVVLGNAPASVPARGWLLGRGE